MEHHLLESSKELKIVESERDTHVSLAVTVTTSKLGAQQVVYTCNSSVT